MDDDEVAPRAAAVPSAQAFDAVDAVVDDRRSRVNQRLRRGRMGEEHDCGDGGQSCKPPTRGSANPPVEASLPPPHRGSNSVLSHDPSPRPIVATSVRLRHRSYSFVSKESITPFRAGSTLVD